MVTTTRGSRTTAVADEEEVVDAGLMVEEEDEVEVEDVDGGVEEEGEEGTTRTSTSIQGTSSAVVISRTVHKTLRVSSCRPSSKIHGMLCFYLLHRLHRMLQIPM
ncbi:hypothetical protein Poli38472_001634 [Pythium oligandrum]|uniref:Uncharacterized protein n=1 Tax=Pythium oligandrum TaxID=41045 RepID=A0A8K1FTD4_PYTOL|nr:hypothetical protein Poli38472_001634 [Pythium oligandrum]|eukprot:TMW69478.1 hypothetical protein Poli38472_001634 [Pythium oligandrum]